MYGIRPTLGVEFEDKYKDAKNKLIDFVKALDELTQEERNNLATEFITSFGVATSFDEFVRHMNGGSL